MVIACLHRRRRSEEHTSELQSLTNLVCRLLLEKNRPACRFVCPREPCEPHVHLRGIAGNPRPRSAWRSALSLLDSGVGPAPSGGSFFFRNRAPPELPPLPPRDAFPF